MANSIEIRELVKTFLNDTLVDPLTSRRGNQFYSDIDGFNFSRGDTFPKGYIEAEIIPVQSKSNMGDTGWSKSKVILTIYYYNVDKGKYNTGTYNLEGADVTNYILELAAKTLRGHKFTGYANYPEQISEISYDGLVDTGNFSLHQGHFTISYYWFESY